MLRVAMGLHADLLTARPGHFEQQLLTEAHLKYLVRFMLNRGNPTSFGWRMHADSTNSVRRQVLLTALKDKATQRYYFVNMRKRANG